MYNQSFNVDNFRAVFDRENRKGVFVEALLSSTVRELTKQIKVCSAEIRTHKARRGLLKNNEFRIERERLRQKHRELHSQKAEVLSTELHNLCREVASGDFSGTLRQKTIPSGKTAYTLSKQASVFFAVKQVQQNIRNLYRVKQSSRYEIVCQMKAILRDRFPKYVIRTDLANFYESIPQKKILEIIAQDSILGFPSVKIISHILRDFASLTGSNVGLPRGVGISAYLAELYLRSFDEAIRAHKEVTYYARYVDDIVVIFTPLPGCDVKLFMPFVTSEISKLDLKLNPSKTKEYDVRKPTPHVLDYLGYAISFGQHPEKFKIAISVDKKNRWKKRISLAFKTYKIDKMKNEKKARKILVKRVHFLTGNTRLHYSKTKVIIGSYYSNSLLSNHHEFEALDNCLTTYIETLESDTLKKRLRKLTFTEGFSSRRYVSFDSRQLDVIAEVWKK